MRATRSTFMFDNGPAELRARLAELREAHLPADWLGPFTHDERDITLSNQFCSVLADNGLLIPEWPVEYGGRAADLASGIVIREEMWAYCEPRGPQYYGPNWVGPSIMQYGTDAQRRQHIPAIAAGREIWCQGFSEPEAGTDLASIRTKAVRDGDRFVITGQKVWTSWALWARWCYLLARVEDPEGGPSGITVLLIPMDRAGITVRGIDGIPGPHHLNEVFLDGVSAERSEVLGEIGGGWRVVRDALSNERVGIARYARSDRVLTLIAPYVRSSEIGSPGLPRRWIHARVRNRMARLLCRHALYLQQGGGSNDFVVSAARLLTTRADQQVADIASDVLADRFFEDRYTDGAPLSGLIEFFWRYSQAATIASGTTEALQILLSRRLFKGDALPVAAEVADLTNAVGALITRFGGIGAAREARMSPETRRPVAAALAEQLAGLDPRADELSALAAAEACRCAGRFVTPVPLEAMLMSRDDGIPLALVSASGRLEHCDLFDNWLTADQSGDTMRSTCPGPPLGTRTGSFVSSAMSTVGECAQPLSPAEHSLLHTLTGWFILGALEQALDMAVRYAQDRYQFDRPIGQNQGVAFPLADASAELQGLHKLGEFSLWRIQTAGESALVDALAFRWAALEIGRRVLRICHQVHGAIGLCEENDLAIITMALQPRLRMPLGIDDTEAALMQANAKYGFDSIYAPAPRRD